MADRCPFTAAEKREAIEREIAMRRRVYPRWVDDRKMSQAKADHEIAVMVAIAEDYRQQETGERLL